MDDFIEVASMEPQPREAMSPVSDKVSGQQQSQNSTADPIELPASASNGQRSRLDRSNKASSVISTVSTENPTIPQISVTDSSSTTDATPSLVNGRATASESLSSLSEIDTVDSEAETERIEEFDEEPEEVDTAPVAVEDDEGDNDDTLVADGMVITPAIGTSEDEGRSTDRVRQHSHTRKSESQSPTRGRKRRRRENGNDEDTPSDEKPEQPLEDSDELPTKRSRLGSNDEDYVKPTDVEDIDAPVEEAEEAEPEEGTHFLLTSLIVVDEEKAELNKKRLAALEMLKEIEDEFAKLRDR